MNKKIKIFFIAIVSIIGIALIYVFTYVPGLSDLYGRVQSELFLSEAKVKL